MMAWATVVAERLRFGREEALSIGRYVSCISCTVIINVAFSGGVYGNELDKQRGGYRDIQTV